MNNFDVTNYFSALHLSNLGRKKFNVSTSDIKNSINVRVMLTICCRRSIYDEILIINYNYLVQKRFNYLPVIYTEKQVR